MGGITRRKCRDCGISGIWLSRKGLCYNCVINRIKMNAKQLKDRKGPTFDAWVKGVTKYAEKK